MNKEEVEIAKKRMKDRANKIKLRQKANQAIIDILGDAITQWPDMRLHQILEALGVLKRYEWDGDHTPDGYQNEFNTESVDVLKRVVEEHGKRTNGLKKASMKAKIMEILEDE